MALAVLVGATLGIWAFQIVLWDKLRMAAYTLNLRTNCALFSQRVFLDCRSASSG